MWPVRRLLDLGLFVVVADCNSLVGPDAVGSYQGEGGGRRYGGTVRVDDPPAGIFVAGSSIRAMNGIYGRVHRMEHRSDRQVHLAYKHDYTGWYMALIANDAEKEAATGLGTMWTLVDNDGTHRFQSDGDTLIPGSGERWTHIHRTTSGDSPDHTAGSQVAVAIDDDMEELPWQVIGIGAHHMMEDLRAHFRYYRHTVQESIQGARLPLLPQAGPGFDATTPPNSFKDPSALDVDAGDFACQTDNPASLQDILAQAVRDGDRWGQATTHRRLAICHRWQREFGDAEYSVSAALALFPRYTSALFEYAMVLLDQGRHIDAIDAFEVLLQVDRQWPSIDQWLVRAHVHNEREETSKNALLKDAAFEDFCTSWRQTAGCDPWGTREPDNDLDCDAPVPSGRSGHCECKHERHEADGGEVVTEYAGASDCAPREEFRCGSLCRDAMSKFTKLGGSNEHDADPCLDHKAPTWCSTVPYQVLEMRCDFPLQGEEEELRRAYKRRSLQVHPDKRGGSQRAFQAVAAAYDVLASLERRRAWDEGDDLPREPHDDGSEGDSFKNKILKKYFKERYDFEPFGNPHSDRREREERRKRQLERRRQEALARGEEL